MARPVVGDFLQDATPIFSPVARPTETFVQPGQKGMGSGAALTAALSSFDRIANPILKKEEKKAIESEVTEGEELFRRNRQDFAEAIREGIIPAGASPYVRKGYRRSQLHALGANYAVELARSLEESEVYKVDDPSAIEQHLNDFYNQFIETNGIAGYDNRELAESFSPMIQKAHDGFRMKQADKNIQFIEQERFLSFENEVLATIDMQTFDGSISQVNAAVGNTAAWLKAKADELDGEGLDRTKISRTIVDIITSAAEADEDLDILEVLGSVQLGTGPLSNTKYGREQMVRAEDRIISARLRREQRADIAARRARTSKIEELSLAATLAAEAGDTDAYQAALTELGRYDASEYRSVVSFNDAREGKREETMQAGAFGQVYDALADASTYEEARSITAEAVALGAVPYNDGQQMLNMWQRQNGGGTPEIARFMSFPTANTYRSALERSIIGDEYSEDVPVMKDRATLALMEYDQLRLDWYDQNKRDDGTFDHASYIKAAGEWVRSLREIYIDPDITRSNAKFAAPDQAPAWAQD